MEASDRSFCEGGRIRYDTIQFCTVQFIGGLGVFFARGDHFPIRELVYVAEKGQGPV